MLCCGRSVEHDFLAVSPFGAPLCMRVRRLPSVACLFALARCGVVTNTFNSDRVTCVLRVCVYVCVCVRHRPAEPAQDGGGPVGRVVLPHVRHRKPREQGLREQVPHVQGGACRTDPPRHRRKRLPAGRAGTPARHLQPPAEPHGQPRRGAGAVRPPCTGPDSPAALLLWLWLWLL
jgi:hypothetical protein